MLRRARVATALVFVLFGVTLGAWTARIPEIKARLRLDDPRLSIALLTFAIGCIVGMVAVGRLVDRFGSRQVMVPAAFAEGLLLVPTAHVTTLVDLCLALLVFGIVHGTLNIAMNANAIEVQRAYGRPVVSSFHAIYSIGGFAGAAAGGAFASAGISVATTFACVAAIAVALAAWAMAWALPSSAPPEPATRPVDAGPVRRSRALLFLGVLALCALVGEGVAADWSAVYLHDTLGASTAFAATGYAAFAVMMTAGRLMGDRLTAWLGPVTLVRAGGLLAGCGLGVALLLHSPVAGVVGFGCLGAGLSCVAPQVFSAAGNRDPARPGQALALVVSMGYAGFVLGPVLIGSARTAVGLGIALVIPVALALFVAAGAVALRTPVDPPLDRDDLGLSRAE